MKINIFCSCSLFPSWSARPTSRCILFDGENISFDPSLVIYINSTNIPPIMNINRIYETQNLLSLQLVSFVVRLRIYQHPCTSTATVKGIMKTNVTKFFEICEPVLGPINLCLPLAARIHRLTNSHSACHTKHHCCCPAL